MSMDLRKQLRKAGVAQKTIAEVAGVTEATVSRHLSGERKMTPAVAAAIESELKALGQGRQDDEYLSELLASVMP